MNRRDFTKTAAASLTTAISYNKILVANDRVRVGFIALGNRGDQVLDAFLQLRCHARYSLRLFRYFRMFRNLSSF